MRFMAIIVSTLLAAQVLVATDALANDEEVYRWVDENGVVHFGDRPPEHSGAKKVTIQDGTNSGIRTNPAPGLNQAEAANESEPQPSMAQQRRDERASSRAEAAEQKKIIAAACAEASKRVAQLEPFPHVLVRNEDGSVSRLDDNRRLELLAEAQTFIDANCSK
jgi:hypothetical protein